MSRYDQLNPGRDSLELASLASSPNSARQSTDSSPSISSSRKLSLEAEDPLDDHNAAASGRPGRPRMESMSSAFDFTANLYPLSQTAAGGYARIGEALAPSGPSTGLGGGSLEKHKTLTYLNGLSLIVGLIIGSGIFSSPGQVLTRAGSPAASLLVWAIAGVLAWTGAASYAELGGAIPLNGGPQVYLSKIFGDLFGFLFTWCAVVVLKPGSAAIIAIIFGEYLVRAAVGADAENVSVWINKGVALLGLLLVTGLNCLSTKLGTRIGDTFMFFKFIALLGVTVIGVIVAITGLSAKGDASKEWKTHNWFEGTSTDVSSWAVALYSGLWAFDGWDNTNYVVGEFKNPSRDLPRVIHSAMPLVIICYIFANIAYFFVLPVESIKATNTVAVVFGDKVFGAVGSLVLSLIVSASCLGALNATTFTSGRLVYAAGKDGLMPSIFGRIGLNETPAPSLSTQRTRSFPAKILAKICGDTDGTGLFFTPIIAMLFNACLTGVYIIIGDFSTLVTFYGVAGYTFYFLTVLGLIVLRVREPDLERPYRTWISTPIIFCCVSLFLLSRAVFAEPLQTLIVAGFVLCGIPIWWWRRSRDSGRRRVGQKLGGGIGWKFWKGWR
jgi:amino acid transporter